MIYNINRRKFIELFSYGCCGLILPSCTTVPITKRRQLSIYPESAINNSASKAYENFKTKNKLIIKGKQLDTIKEIGNKIEYAVSNFFLNKDGKDPTSHFEWDYILVENDKMKNAWCMPGGKIAVYTGILKVTQHNLAATWINIPIQDFTKESDIDWSLSVNEIDEQLYKKYNLDTKDIIFIEKMVMTMT